ncbi:hypothetical protein NM688_g6100 [Phlebia brevispora]|uniref:Uncharacterized protein n=1 Tax=Phlebia brevispora TaxID=194682 RepID=A0ACC1SK74_9APHY|nr:hypothetical protein NM688_g6100 [Phlebia brevispora]
MGSASSKAARKLPKTAKPSWSGARTPGPTDTPAAEPTSNTLRSKIPPEAQTASETRTEEIERDSRDPQFLAKLNQLGPVKVDHNMAAFRPAAALAQQVYQTRLQSEVEASSAQTSHNHLLASTLTDLLEDLKYSNSRDDLAALSRRYHIDVDKIESIARFVNTPTVDPDSIVREMGEDGVENMTMKACVMWKNASFLK